MAGIDRRTFYAHIDDRLASDLIEPTRTVGNSPMYRIDRDGAAAEDLAKMEWYRLDAISDQRQARRPDSLDDCFPIISYREAAGTTPTSAFELPVEL